MGFFTNIYLKTKAVNEQARFNRDYRTMKSTISYAKSPSRKKVRTYLNNKTRFTKKYGNFNSYKF